jgi:hypothetical protein
MKTPILLNIFFIDSIVVLWEVLIYLFAYVSITTPKNPSTKGIRKKKIAPTCLSISAIPPTLMRIKNHIKKRDFFSPNLFSIECDILEENAIVIEDKKDRMPMIKIGMYTAWKYAEDMLNKIEISVAIGNEKNAKYLR